ncbi:hypothetical protein HHI36_020154 [Cryptolaemus montrouzieri]|uniref:CRAL-TRIO domain-containing protein n=1 Tax=Cryptolaemus montrouzieri TaxID=559131 RepID=A0ABD2NAG9_9CUCU
MDIVQREYQNDKKLKQEDVKMLEVWLEGQPHLPKMTEQEIIWFLKSCYYSNEATKITIDNYFTMKTMSPEILGNKDVTRKNFQQNMDVVSITVLPKLSHEGYKVMVSRLRDANVDHFNFNEAMKMFDMVAMLDLFSAGTHEGARCCFDVTDVSFGHVARIGIVSMKKFLLYLQEGMPVRLKGLHFFNTTSVMEKLLFIMRPFLKKEVLDILYLHDTVKDMEEYVPLDILPSEYGGKGESLKVHHERMKKNLMANGEFLHIKTVSW